MYHVELRQFPHSFCRFNLSEQELRERILAAWVRGEWVQLGERKWSSHQAKLTVLEGPRLEVQELAMGRGWRNAQRRSEDVTERLLASNRRLAPAQGAALPAQQGVPGTSAAEVAEHKALVDALALELLRLLGDEPVPLMRAWIEQRERHPESIPSECLALAETAVRG
jgi:hypothetical protein